MLYHRLFRGGSFLPHDVELRDAGAPEEKNDLPSTLVKAIAAGKEESCETDETADPC